MFSNLENKDLTMIALFLGHIFFEEYQWSFERPLSWKWRLEQRDGKVYISM